jgi:hypothetical protein
MTLRSCEIRYAFLRTYEQVMGDLHLQMNSDFGGFRTRIKGS